MSQTKNFKQEMNPPDNPEPSALVVAENGGMLVRSAPLVKRALELARSLDTQGKVSPATRRRAILLVDDEILIHEFLSELLAEEYDSLFATDHRSAIDCFAQNRERIAGVTTDLGHPVETGEKLVEWIRKEAPSLPVLILSGWGIQKFPDDPKVVQLTKPSTREEILGALRELGLLSQVSVERTLRKFQTVPEDRLLNESV